MEAMALRMDNPPAVPVTTAEYRGLVKAKDTIQKLASVEEKWDVLVANYRELELQWLSVALDSSLYSSIEIPKLFEVSRELGRRLGNLLSSSRLYTDNLRSKSKAISRETGSFIETKLQQAKASSADFRLMESLRNYLQHQDFPLGTIRQSHREDTASGPKFLFSTSTGLITKAMLSYQRLDPQVRRDLESEGRPSKTINTSIRRYIELLWKVHDDFRRQTRDAATEGNDSLQTVISRISQADETFRAFVQKAFFVLDDQHRPLSGPDGEFSDMTFQNYAYLQEKNGTLVNLHKRFITGETRT